MGEYQNSFYEQIRRPAISSANVICPFIVDVISPTSVVDIGCGTGTWLKKFTELGVKEICGIDGPWVDLSSLEIPVCNFIVSDLNNPISIDKRFDLAISLETAEHIYEKNAIIFINSLVNLAHVVLFSAAIPLQGGPNHYNEQWPSYWASLFNKFDYVPIDIIRKKIWDNPQVVWYYRQNLLIFVEKTFLRNHLKLRQIAKEKENDNAQLDIVHPRLYLKKCDSKLVENIRFSTVARILPTLFFRACVRLFRRHTIFKI